jgi:hypothetical protein
LNLPLQIRREGELEASRVAVSGAGCKRESNIDPFGVSVFGAVCLEEARSCRVQVGLVRRVPSIQVSLMS